MFLWIFILIFQRNYIFLVYSAAVQNERDRIIRRPSQDSTNGITANMLLQAEVMSRQTQVSPGAVYNIIHQNMTATVSNENRVAFSTMS